MNSIRTGKVDWTGDNPFIYLKTDPKGDWSSLSLYFRIAASDYGRGQAILVLENPYQKEDTNAVRLCLTDNLELARYLVDQFVRRFGLFRPAVALDTLEYVADARFETLADYPAHVTERATSDSHNLQIDMIWKDLQDTFAVALPPAETQTGEHEMFCVFQPASSACVEINGQAITGQTVERDFLDRIAQSAALANSESWVRAD
ncbi:NAD-dependent dehydratase [Pontibacterium granulatum]|uniref:NAD-dependent dehydratase n=1 Tax=Pontibacterium granulatum TaxID=2036029 RepID=UPI00249BC959|nr:NAD-dependent dehydratase [Pontibacterium granulatum]MDI3325198.1 NAD-dependent dehydratase [Pontibacterium granulatum]